MIVYFVSSFSSIHIYLSLYYNGKDFCIWLAIWMNWMNCISFTLNSIKMKVKIFPIKLNLIKFHFSFEQHYILLLFLSSINNSFLLTIFLQPDGIMVIKKPVSLACGHLKKCSLCYIQNLVYFHFLKCPLKISKFWHKTNYN